jgi:hypothetical protein
MSAPVVLIAFCSGDLVHADFTMSCIMMQNHLRDVGVSFGFGNFKCSLISVGRNAAAQAAIDTEATHLFMLDTDMVFPSTTLTQLLKHDLDIVGSSYCNRHSPRRMNHYTFNNDFSMPDNVAASPVKYVGTGCMLVKTSVFKSVPFPWFHVEHHAPSGIDNYTGEDVYFCDKARGCAFDVNVDWHLSRTVRHIGSVQLDYTMVEIP